MYEVCIMLFSLTMVSRHKSFKVKIFIIQNCYLTNLLRNKIKVGTSKTTYQNVNPCIILFYRPFRLTQLLALFVRQTVWPIWVNNAVTSLATSSITDWCHVIKGYIVLLIIITWKLVDTLTVSQ